MERKDGTYRRPQSEVSHSYEEQEPRLVGFQCSDGDWFTSETEYFRALADFGRHNLDAHEGSIGVHIEYVYAEPSGRKRR